VGKGKETKERKKMELSPEEKKRRSELAKKLHEEGKFGGPQKNAGRPKKDRAQEVVAEKIRDSGNEIFNALKSALESDSPSVKLKAALAMLDVENSEVEHQRKEAKEDFEDATKEELIQFIIPKLKEFVEAGLIPAGFVAGVGGNESERVETNSIATTSVVEEEPG
jgi:hypothetical protein